MNENIGPSRVYGGVCLLLKVDFGYVKPNPQAYSFSAITEFNNRKKAKSSSHLNIPSDGNNNIDEHSYGMDMGSLYTDSYDNGRRDEEGNSRNLWMPEEEQRWITVFLQSDPNIDNPDDDAMHTFDNVDDCLDYLSSANNEYVLVVVCDKYANDKQTLLKLQESLSVSVIYRKLGGGDQQSLYTDKELKDICPKLQGSFIGISPLSQRFTNSFSKTFNVFSPDDTQNSTRNLTEESVTFLWYQIMIDLLLSSATTLQTKEDFFGECQRGSQDNSHRLMEIARIKKSYQAKHALTYYTKYCWFYELINKALRLQNISSIYRLRLGIIDLHKCMLVSKSKHTRKVTLYRGQIMGTNEMDKVLRNINGLLSFNSFLSTSRSNEVARMYADIGNQRETVDDQLLVIFEMNVMENQFSDIMNMSSYPDEEECLFVIGTIFMIISVEKKITMEKIIIISN